MADKYLKGARVYHLVETGKKVTKCGFDVDKAGRMEKLESTKSIPGWTNCVGCTNEIATPLP